MALKPVAVEGDASASGGDQMYQPADEGEWTPGPVVLTSYDKLTVGGTKVIHKAECEFTFDGMNNKPNTPVAVSGTSSVTLEADGTVLMGGSTMVLVDGDSNEDSYGNEISISASGILQAEK